MGKIMISLYATSAFMESKISTFHYPV